MVPPMRWVVALTMLGACYAPNAPTDVPCGENGACPTGQTCQAGFCSSRSPADPDAAVSPDGDPADAPPDTPGIPAQLVFGERPGALPGTFIDTFLDVDEPENNFGAHPDLHLFGAADEPILLRTDLDAVPAIATITGARFKLVVT